MFCQYKTQELTVQFIVSGYIPKWFDIKVTYKWTKRAQYILKQLQLVRKQEKTVQLDIE